MWLVGDQLYVFGGVTSQFETLNDLWSFDLAAHRWTELTPEGAAGSPDTRHEAAAGTYPALGTLTVYGGEHIDLVHGAFFTTLADTWELDLTTRSWRNVTPPPAENIRPERDYGSE